MNTYGIDIWGDNNFFIDKDLVKVNYKSTPSLYEIVKEVRQLDFKGPLLLRFPHITKKQISTLYDNFDKARAEYNYKGSFNAVFPLKVNQLPSFVQPLIQAGKEFNYG